MNSHSHMNTVTAQKISAEQASEYDTHWNDVLKLAEKYGFIRQSYGGTAILVTHANIIEHENN